MQKQTPNPCATQSTATRAINPNIPSAGFETAGHGNQTRNKNPPTIKMGYPDMQQSSQSNISKPSTKCSLRCVQIYNGQPR
ncbi:hypothetical protein VTJ04DRAFT_34 [Mycothermus thermophilus]|uniref:uncharacterized protein n=1 Tax=Humicola insolens TaxID=85995 RepID=UPI003744A147